MEINFNILINRLKNINTDCLIFDDNTKTIKGIDNTKITKFSPETKIYYLEDVVVTLREFLYDSEEFPIKENNIWYYPQIGFFTDNIKNPTYIAKYSDNNYKYQYNTVEFIPKPQINPSIFDSKIGGDPYWNPKEINRYPVDKKGNSLALLCQINLSTELYKDPRLPKKGILQFFIKNDDLLGLKIDKREQEKGETRIVYHPNVDYSINSIKIPYSSDCMLFKKSTAISLNPIIRKVISKDNYWNNRLFSSPVFIQSNPISLNTQIKNNYICLLQLDSDDRFKMRWGDNGTCQ